MNIVEKIIQQISLNKDEYKKVIVTLQLLNVYNEEIHNKYISSIKHDKDENIHSIVISDYIIGILDIFKDMEKDEIELTIKDENKKLLQVINSDELLKEIHSIQIKLNNLVNEKLKNIFKSPESINNLIYFLRWVKNNNHATSFYDIIFDILKSKTIEKLPEDFANLYISSTDLKPVELSLYQQIKKLCLCAVKIDLISQQTLENNYYIDYDDIDLEGGYFNISFWLSEHEDTLKIVSKIKPNFWTDITKEELNKNIMLPSGYSKSLTHNLLSHESGINLINNNATLKDNIDLTKINDKINFNQPNADSTYAYYLSTSDNGLNFLIENIDYISTDSFFSTGNKEGEYDCIYLNMLSYMFKKIIAQDANNSYIEEVIRTSQPLHSLILSAPKEILNCVISKGIFEGLSLAQLLANITLYDGTLYDGDKPGLTLMRANNFQIINSISDEDINRIPDNNNLNIKHSIIINLLLDPFIESSIPRTEEDLEEVNKQLNIISTKIDNDNVNFINEEGLIVYYYLAGFNIEKELLSLNSYRVGYMISDNSINTIQNDNERFNCTLPFMIVGAKTLGGKEHDINFIRHILSKTEPNTLNALTSINGYCNNISIYSLLAYDQEYLEIADDLNLFENITTETLNAEITGGFLDNINSSSTDSVKSILQSSEKGIYILNKIENRHNNNESTSNNQNATKKRRPSL